MSDNSATCECQNNPAKSGTPCADWCGKDLNEGRIVGLFFNPPMAIARVGRAKKPMVAYRWKVDENPHRGVQTMIEPALTLEPVSVSANGHPPHQLELSKPDKVTFKDRKGRVRPVAPFFELWARLQDEKGELFVMPVSEAFLEARRVRLRDLHFTVTAANRKAQARTKLASCAAIAHKEFRADQFKLHKLDAISPHTEGEVPLVRPDAPLRLGNVQTFKANASDYNCWHRLDQIRLRFTPGKGDSIGPPEASEALASPRLPGEFEPAVTEYGNIHKMTRPENRILSSDTPWLGYNFRADKTPKWPTPMDSYDGARVGSSNGWGRIDDTCDLQIEAKVAIKGQLFKAKARAFAGPPDFAPDKRPMYSIRDDLEDRELPAAELDKDKTHREIHDLFRRIFETASLFNLDQRRDWALEGNAAILGAQDSKDPDWDEGFSPRLGPKSMRSDDKPYAELVPEYTPGQGDTVEATSGHANRLPYTMVVQQVHARLADSPNLRAFLARRPDRVRQLVRPPFARLADLPHRPGLQKPAAVADRNSGQSKTSDQKTGNGSEELRYRDPRSTLDQTYDMRMPPYMRHSMGVPLSISRRQYNLLMDFLDKLESDPTWR